MIKISLTRSGVFLIGCLFFIFGIVISSFLPVEILKRDLFWFSFVVVCAVFLVLFFDKEKIRLAALWALFFFLAFWRYSVALPVDSPDKIWHYNEQNIVFSGVVVAEPDIRNDNVKLKIKSEKILSQKARVTGYVLVTTNLYPRYNYGDRLEITCELKQPEEFSGFAYDRYLARYDIYSICYYPKIVLLNTGHGSWFYDYILKLKSSLYENIDRGLVGPEASIAGPIILGGQQGVSDDLRHDFSITGLTHIMAVSGSNISILSGIVLFIFLGLGFNRKSAFYFSVIFLIVYVVLVGSPASAVRAGLMGFLVLWALYLGRLNKIVNVIVLASVIMLLFNPRLLRDDVGFQLSFGAVISLIYFYPIFDEWLEYFRLPRFYGLRDIFSATLAAQVFTLPIITYNFSQISLVSPLANLLVIWTIPILTAVILGAMILGAIFPSGSVLFFTPAWLILKYIIFTVENLARIPYASVNVESLWLGWVVIYYIAVTYFLVKRKKALYKSA